MTPLFKRVNNLGVPGEDDLKVIDPRGVPTTVSPLLSMAASASCIVVPTTLNLRVHPIVAPADVSIELVLIVISEVPDILLVLDKVILPPTVSLALLLSYPCIL